MKFSIINSFHRDDKGDAALLHVLIDQLLQIDPKADITVSSMEDPSVYKNFYKARNIGSFELYSSSHMHPSPWHLFVKVYLFFAMVVVGLSHGHATWLFPKKVRGIYDELFSADIVISVGGGYFITKRDLGSRMHLLFALQTLILCKQIGRKVVTAPVSVGPFQKTFEGKYTAWLLKKLDLVILREDVSKKNFVNNDGNLPLNIQRAPDSGFAFSPDGSFDIRSIVGANEGDFVLAISVRNWMTKTKQDIYEQAHADLIDYIAEKYPNIKPVFIPQCTFPHADDDDRVVAKRVYEKSKSKKVVVINDELDYKQVKLAYEKADLVVGTRFHAMVFGLSYLVPGIAIEYEHKTRGIMRDLDLEKWVIKIDNVDSQLLIKLFGELVINKSVYSKNLLKVIPPYRKLAEDAMRRIVNI